MNGRPRDLRQLQQWMQAVIMHPGGVEHGMNSDEARRHIDVRHDDLESVVSRSRALSAEDRLAIYNRAYFSRLVECLRAEFPVLVYALGEDTFDSFALAYLQRYPSRSYTLGRLAANFADYLAETRPRDYDCASLTLRATARRSEPDASASHAGELPSWPDFVIDLATFEWTFSEVFDGPGVEEDPPLRVEDLQAIPPERWPEARLVPVRSLRLKRFRFPVNTYFNAVRRKQQPAIPQPAETFVAVTRLRYVVIHYALSRPQFLLLDGLVAGQAVGEAIADLVRAAGGDLDALTKNVQAWFRDWASEGFFSAVET